ncbi:MAG: DUF6152 family protein [Acidobacteriota bacterium]|nr:DUF6152 family protein [Acidobacteriota bacterium]
MKAILRSASVTLATLVLSCAAFGHHSFDAEFDSEKAVSVDGTVTKIEWINPHSFIYIDVTGKDGKVVNFSVEGGPVGMLRRWGIEKDLLKPGEKIHVNGFASKDGSNRMAGWQFVLPDGTKKQMGPLVRPLK